MKKSSTFREKIIQGASLTIVSQGATTSIRFISNVVLARLLLPDSFGLMALVNIIIMGLFLLSDTGTGANIIRHSRGDDPVFCNTMWTVQVIRGLLLSLICLIVAKPLAGFYEQPQLVMVLSVMTICVFVEGFQSTSLRLKERNLQLKAVIFIEVTAQLLSVIVMVTWTLISPTIWGLVAGSVSSAFYKMISSHVINREQPNRFCWQKETVQEATRFGKWIFLSTAFSFFATQSDRILLGKLMPIEVLGVYHIARALVQIPFHTISQLSGKIIYPMMSNYNRENSLQLNEKIAKLKSVILPGIVLCLITILVFEEPFFKLFYKIEYHDAIWIVPFLLIRIWFDVLVIVANKFPLVTGKSDIMAYTTAVSFLTKFSLGLFGFYLFELRGFLIGQIAGGFLTYLFLVLKLKKININAAFHDVRYSVILFTLFFLIKALYSIQFLKVNYFNTLCSMIILSIFAFWVYTKMIHILKSESIKVS